MSILGMSLSGRYMELKLEIGTFVEAAIVEGVRIFVLKTHAFGDSG